MNYEKIYHQLITKRRLYKIDRTKDNKNIQYHHIIPVSCGGIPDNGISKYNNENFNIIGLTIREHFFAHLLLLKIYQKKYGNCSLFYKNMLKAVQMMIDYKKYHIKISSFYQHIKLNAIITGTRKTTTGYIWVTNGKRDILLKPTQKIPDGFQKGRIINFTQQQKNNYSKKISKAMKGKIPWNAGKRNIYSIEYRKKISESHADVSGQKNGRFGSRMMIKIETQQKILVAKQNIQKYLNDGYVIANQLKKFNNGIIEILDKECPMGFKPGKLKLKLTH